MIPTPFVADNFRASAIATVNERIPLAFAARLRDRGLDLVGPFAAADVIGRLDGFPLETFGRPRALGLVIGNSKALWPRLLAALPDPPGDDPVDAHCARVLAEAAEALGGLRHRIYRSEITTPRPIPIQRIAEAAGLAALSPSHLSVHPEHGPWIALRAVVMLDAEGPATPVAAPPLCDGCARPCMPALERALAADRTRDRDSVAQHHALWIAVRDACPVGRASRYDPAQLAYHYTKDRSLLR